MGIFGGTVRKSIISCVFNHASGIYITFLTGSHCGYIFNLQNKQTTIIKSANGLCYINTD